MDLTVALLKFLKVGKTENYENNCAMHFLDVCTIIMVAVKLCQLPGLFISNKK